MSDQKPSYWAVVPAAVRYDTGIPANAKLLYAELSALADKNGYCFPSNAYLSEVFTLTDTSVRRLLKALSERGYINIDVTRDEETHQVVARSIYVGLNPLRCEVPSAQKCTEGSAQKCTEGSAQKSAEGSAQKCSRNNRNIKSNIINPPIAPKGGEGGEKKKSTRKKQPEENTPEEERFEKFWVFYRDTYCAEDHSRAGDKAKAKKAWLKIKVDNKLAAKIWAYLKSKMQTELHQRGYGIQYASTLLNAIARNEVDLTPPESPQRQQPTRPKKWVGVRIVDGQEVDIFE